MLEWGRESVNGINRFQKYSCISETGEIYILQFTVPYEKRMLYHFDAQFKMNG